MYPAAHPSAHLHLPTTPHLSGFYLHMPPPPPRVPDGWKAEFDDRYQEWYIIAPSPPSPALEMLEGGWMADGWLMPWP